MLRKILILFCVTLNCVVFCAQDILTQADSLSLYQLDEVSVVGFYREDVKSNMVEDRAFLVKNNKGQEPSFVLSKKPSIFAYSETGNEYGYSYFRVRGMDQTRVNMTLDGMPLNEGEDMGVYFSNYPDLLSSLHSVRVESGASISGNGVAGYAGSIDFESIDLLKDTTSSVYFGYGSYNTLKSSVDYNSGLKKNWAFHLKATHQQSDGFREHAYNNSQSIFLKVGYFFNARHSIDLISFVGYSRNGQGWIGSSFSEIGQNYGNNGCSEKEIDAFMQNINKIQYKGILNDNIEMMASIYYNQLKGYYFFDLDNYMHKLVDTSWVSTGEIDCYNLRHHMVGGNIAAKFYLRSFVFTAGINASTFNRRHIGTNNISDAQMWNNIGYKNDINLFARGEYKFRGLGFSANMQYRHADFKYVGDKDFDKLNWDFFNWSGRVNYCFDKHHSLYGIVTQTHREPTRSDMFGGNENFEELITTQPESVFDCELGYNLEIKQFIVNLNFYYMDFHNELILNGAMGANGLPLRTNVANSFRSGVELSFSLTPLKGLLLRNTTSYSINKIKLEDGILNHVMSPNWLINQLVSYTYKGVEVGADMKFRSRMFFDLLNQYDLKPSTRLGVYAIYTYCNTTFGVYFNNIFNQRSYSNGMIGVDGPLYFVESPINFHIDVRWTF